MRRLKLIQGLSYAVRGFSCALGVPFGVEDDLAERLLFTGRFEELPCVPDNDDMEDKAENTLLDYLDSFGENEDKLGDATSDMDSGMTNGIDMTPDMDNTEKTGVVPDNDKQFSERELSADGIAKMKKAELEALAAEKQIDISDCSNNDERAAKICGVLGLASTVQMGLED
ncbi:MAG: hypothetical protein K1W27_07000 [Lachnospiraceae bacterium]|jgi:hypothetical protein|nr:hypothetical protein C804_05822 [Lachnospiraceae bacterium A4]